MSDPGHREEAGNRVVLTTHRFQGSLGAADYAADLVDEYFSATIVRGKL